MKLNKTKVNIGELLEQLIAETVPMADQTGVEIRTYPPEEKIFISADGDKLMRVFENLFSNAIQYGKEDKVIEVIWRADDSESVIEVINYGEPIPSSDLPYIFERFYRVEKSRAEHTGGTGLGLAIAKNIVELHDGKITAYSDFERTVFETRLNILRES
jgi:signal transduction histidine kinase